MYFLPQLASFLREHGEIYTVRRFNYRTHLCDIEGVGRCNRKLIRRITAPVDLISYATQSGFESVPVWWAQIWRFIRKDEDMFLFKVIVKR